MPNILVLYGTTDGHTRKIADAIGKTIAELGGSVEIVDARETGPEHRPENYDGTLVAGSLHAERFQRALRRWVRENVDPLNRRPSALLTVCLAVLETRPDAREALEKAQDRLLNDSGWHPTATRYVAGALAYTRYGWLKRRIMRRFAARMGNDTDISRDYEYTDWADLSAFVRDFLLNNRLVKASA